MITLDDCPACGSRELSCVFPKKQNDNSLSDNSGKEYSLVPGGFDIARHKHSFWSVCSNCALIFARNRPSPAGLSTWYPQVFQIAEERGYNTDPLPKHCLDGKSASAARLFAVLTQHKILDGAKSAIMFRSGPGHLLDLIRTHHPSTEVYGLEYFKHPANFARKLVGKERIAEISLPEPTQPFPVKKFDVVISNHFFTHAHEPRKLVDYYRSILADDGRLVIFNEIDHSISLKSFKAYPRGLNFFHKQLFTRQTLTAFLRSGGLQVEDISTSNGGRLPKYITLVCRKAEAQKIPPVSGQNSLSLMRSWNRRHKIYGFAKPLLKALSW